MHARSESETAARGDEAYSSTRQAPRQEDFSFLVKDSTEEGRDLGRKNQEETQGIQANDVEAIRIGSVFAVGSARRGNPT